jgi:hypothetical protein
MEYAPIPSLMFTFWLYGNKQMFDNKIDKVKTQGELTLSHHTFNGASGFKFSQLNQSEKALLYTIGMVIMYLIIEKVYLYYKK